MGSKQSKSNGSHPSSTPPRPNNHTTPAGRSASHRPRAATAGLPPAAAPLQQQPPPSGAAGNPQQQRRPPMSVNVTPSAARPANATVVSAAATSGTAAAPGAHRSQKAPPKPAEPAGKPASAFPPTHRPSEKQFPHSQCKWRFELLATMVDSRAIAAFSEGVDDYDADTAPEECPLCMLFYGTGLNNCSRCGQGMCSDCFAYLVDPKPTASKCPFCDTTPFKVSFRGRRTDDELRKMKEEEDTMKRREREQLDAAIREEQERIERKSMSFSVSPGASPQAGPARSPAVRPPTPPMAELPAASPLTPQELRELPEEVRRAIRHEESTQHVITYFRHRCPTKVPQAGGIAARLMSTGPQAGWEALTAKYGPQPTVAEAAADVVLRLRVYYQLRDRAMPDGALEALVARFDPEPWRAMAAVVLEAGPEFDPSAVPLPPTSSTANMGTTKGAPSSAASLNSSPAGVTVVVDSPTAAAAGGPSPSPRRRAASAALSPTAARGASNASFLSTPGGRSDTTNSDASPLASPYGAATAESVRRGMRDEVMRQRVVSLLRFHRPDLIDELQALLAGASSSGDGENGDPLVTQQHVSALSARLGPEPSGPEFVADIKRRVAHFYEHRVRKGRQDVDALVTRFAGREHELMAALVLKYGPEPPGAPLPPSSVNRPHASEEEVAVVISGTPSSSAGRSRAGHGLADLAEEADDPELAAALRASLLMSQQEQQL